MKKYMIKYGGTLLVLIFVFVPLLYITNFSFLAADDFCRATISWGKIPSEFINWYTGHNGRYTNAIFSLLPVYELQVNRIILALSIIILGVVLYHFISKISTHFKLKISPAENIFLTCLIYATLIAQLPSLYEFFYWYAAVTVYLYSVILFLLFFILIIDLKQAKKVNLWLGALIIILLNGNNEMYLGITNLALLFLIIADWQKGSINGRKIFLLIISCISSVLVLVSPGSINRQSSYDSGGDFFDSFISSILSTGMFIFKSLIEFPYLVFIFGLLLLILNLNSEKKAKPIYYNPLTLALISFLLFSTSFFVVYYATGYLRTYQGRVGNTIHVLYLVILIFNLFNLAGWIKDKTPITKKKIYYFSRGLITIYIVLLFIGNENYHNMWKDLYSGDLQQFSTQLKERENKLKNSDNEKLSLREIKGTRLIEFKDITKDPLHWKNECYRKTVNKKFNLKLKEVKTIN